jgi:hypothetical protein
MKHSGYRTLAVAAAFGALASTLPAAANAQMQMKAQKACRSDYSQLCAGTQPGGGRILACLKSHSDKLSQPCKDALDSLGK